MFEQFHFLHPVWLWALAPLAGLIWYLRRATGRGQPLAPGDRTASAGAVAR